MACKRSRARATQAALSASGIFDQAVMSASVRPHPTQTSPSSSVHRRTQGLGQVLKADGKEEDMRHSISQGHIVRLSDV